MKDLRSTTTVAQRQRLISHMKQYGSVSTPQARYELDIPHPAARVHELRHIHGHNIVTSMVSVINPGGEKHIFANYSRRLGCYGQADKKATKEGNNHA